MYLCPYISDLARSGPIAPQSTCLPNPCSKPINFSNLAVGVERIFRAFFFSGSLEDIYHPIKDLMSQHFFSSNNDIVVCDKQGN